MGVGATTLATAATIAGGVAAVGGTAYELSQGKPKVAAPPAAPPQANPASLANSAAVGTAASARARAASAAGGQRGGPNGGAGGSGGQAGAALTAPPDTTHTSLLGGGS